MLYSLLSLLLFAAAVWAIVNIVQSNESTGTKALWIVLVLVLPLAGVIIWYLMGPKSS